MLVSFLFSLLWDQIANMGRSFCEGIIGSNIIVLKMKKWSRRIMISVDMLLHGEAFLGTSEQRAGLYKEKHR